MLQQRYKNKQGLYFNNNNEQWWKHDSLDLCLCKRVFSFSINFFLASVILLTHNEHSLGDGANNIIGFFWSFSLSILVEFSEPSLKPKLTLPFVSESPKKDNSFKNIGCKEEIFQLVLSYYCYSNLSWDTFLYILNFWCSFLSNENCCPLDENFLPSTGWANSKKSFVRNPTSSFPLFA